MNKWTIKKKATTTQFDEKQRKKLNQIAEDHNYTLNFKRGDQVIVFKADEKSIIDFISVDLYFKTIKIFLSNNFITPSEINKLYTELPIANSIVSNVNGVFDAWNLGIKFN